MNEQNFDYLRNQLKYTGFGDLLQRELRAKMSASPSNPAFTLLFRTLIGDDQAEAVLQFRKSEDSEMYFFNRYSLQLKNGQGMDAHIQTYRINRENSITLKEAYNMLKGRAIYKEILPKDGEKYHAWLQLNLKETNEHGDFKTRQFHPNYGYHLKQILENFEIKELENPETAQALIRSLERGNRQAVSIRHEGKEEKMFIEASPQYKSVNIYNNQQLRINLRSHGITKKEAQKQTGAEKETSDLDHPCNLSEQTNERKRRKRIRKLRIS